MSSGNPPAAGDGYVRLLEADLQRVQNAVAHLVSSNTELKAAIEEEGDEDREYKTAIEENIVLIAKYRGQMERLEQEIRELRGGRQVLGGEAITTEEAAAALAAAGAAAAAVETTPQQRQQEEEQEDSIAAVHGGDTAMRDAEQQQQQQQEPGGMWM